MPLRDAVDPDINAALEDVLVSLSQWRIPPEATVPTLSKGQRA